MYSFSGLSLSSDPTFGCWRKVWFRYGLDLRGDSSPALDFGKAIHGVISTMIENQNQELAEPLIDCLQASMDFSDEDVEEMAKMVATQAVIDAVYGRMANNINNEGVEEYFELDLDSTPFSPRIRGYIDYYYIENDTIYLYDWKSNRRMYEPQDTHQLGLYALYLSQKYNLPVIGRLAFIRFNTVKEHLYTYEDMEASREWALETALEYDANFIKQKNGESIDALFPKQPGRACEYCGYKNLCLEIPNIPKAIVSPEDAKESLNKLSELKETVRACEANLKDYITQSGNITSNTFTATINKSDYLRFDLAARKAVVAEMQNQGLDIGSILKIGSDAQTDLIKKHGWVENDFLNLGAKKGSTTRLSIEKI